MFYNIFIICILGAAAAVKMMVRAFREDPAEAREKEKDLILDDHTQCGCSCGEESGHGHTVTCWHNYNNSFPCLPYTFRLIDNVSNPPSILLKVCVKDRNRVILSISTE